MKNFKDEWGFTNGIYKCHSLPQKDFLYNNGIKYAEKEIVKWNPKERQMFREKNEMAEVDLFEYQEVERTRWIYKGSQKLSEALKSWSASRPKKEHK